MKNQTIIGVDFSITSPSVTILTERPTIFSVLKTKEIEKLQSVVSPKINCLVDPKKISGAAWEDNHEGREILIADSIANCILKECRFENEFHIAIEGYSFGSRNTFAHKIGEATGCLIYALSSVLPNVKFYRPSPPAVKKAVGAKQKDGKTGVYEKFSERFDVDLIEILEKKKLDGPITDICDSWACAVWMKTHIDTLNQLEKQNGKKEIRKD